MIAAALLSSSSSSSLKSTSTMTTTTSLKTTTPGQQVRTLIPVTTSDGSKVFVSGPCIVLKTQTSAPTVAQQMQALRPLLKADTNSNTPDPDKEKKPNDRNNNNNNNSDNTNNNNSNSSSSITSKKGSGSNSENEPQPLRCKRRIDFTSLGLPRPQPAAMARRNERERNRVKQVNLGFETLRQHVPHGRKNKKLSKVDTLKEAVKYIKYLHQLLMEADENADTTTISDTITIVSRPSATTTTNIYNTTTTTSNNNNNNTKNTATTPSPPTVTPTLTSSTLKTSIHTATMTSSELMHLNTSAVDTSTTMDFSCESTNDLGCDSSADVAVNNSYNAFRLKVPSDCGPLDVGPVGQLSNVQELTNAPQQVVDSVDKRNNPSSNFVELTPAQLNFNHHHRHHHHHHQNQSATPSNTTATTMETEHVQRFLTPSTNIDHLRVSVDPNINTDFAILPTIFNLTPPSSTTTFMEFNSTSTSTTSSPDGSPQDAHPVRLAELQSYQTEQRCRGSEGSCPVSPSESSGASESPEECLGVSEGETWQDLSADIAEWLCSKIDIDDPDVFV